MPSLVKPRSRLAAALLALVATSVLLSAQDSAAQLRVVGTVVSKATNNPLDHVDVYVPRLRRGTSTNAEGHFEIDGFGSGDYAVEFSRVGFQKVVRNVSFSKAAGQPQQVRLDAALEEAAIDAGEVIVVADAPRATSTIPNPTLTVSEIDRLNRGHVSLWDDLADLPGVAKSTNGPGIERPFIRGLSAGRVMVLVDNLPYSFQTWDPEAGLSTDGNGTEQVDIIEGPATLRYGPGAMGGVISLAPERPPAVGHIEGSYTGAFHSSTEGVYSELAARESHKSWFWGLRAGFESHADYKPGGEGEEVAPAAGDGEGRVPNSRYDHLKGQGFIGVSRPWGSSRLTVQFLRHRNGIVEAEAEEAGAEEEGEREIHAPYHDLEDAFVTSDTQYRLGDGWLHAVVGIQANHQEEFEPDSIGGQEPEAAIDLRLMTLHYRFEYEMPLSPLLSLTAGLHGQVQKNESEGGEPFIPSSDALQNGVFGLLTLQQGPLVVEGGLRYDFQSLKTTPAIAEAESGASQPGGEETEIERTYGMASGSIGATYTVADGRFVKVNAGVGNRAPDVAELTADGLLREIRRYLIGDDALDSEYNVEGDVSVGWKLPAVTLSAGAFYNHILRFIFPMATGESTTDGFPVYAYRQADADFRGGNAGVTIHPEALGGLQLFSRVDLVVADISDGSGYSAPMIPAPRVVSGVDYATGAVGPFSRLGFEAEVDTHVKQENVAPWETDSEGYSLVNASVNARLKWHHRDVLIGLHGLNLANKEYVDHLSLLKPDGIPNVGRTVALTVRVPFGT